MEGSKELVKGNIGAEGQYSLDFAAGNIKIGLGYDGKYADTSIVLSVSLIEALKVAAAKTENKMSLATFVPARLTPERLAKLSLSLRQFRCGRPA